MYIPTFELYQIQESLEDYPYLALVKAEHVPEELTVDGTPTLKWLQTSDPELVILMCPVIGTLNAILEKYPDMKVYGL